MKQETINQFTDLCQKQKDIVTNDDLRRIILAEPDRLNWKYEGLDCMIVRNFSFLHLCGYVGIKKDHPYFKKDYDECHVEVHGGLTYGSVCGGYICHIPENDDEDEIYWLGFDCAHSGDVSPSIRAYFGEERNTYKDIKYVMAEVNSLARQLKEIQDDQSK